LLPLGAGGLLFSPVCLVSGLAAGLSTGVESGHDATIAAGSVSYRFTMPTMYQKGQLHLGNGDPGFRTRVRVSSVRARR
jgi:hypothetical protein